MSGWLTPKLECNKKLQAIPLRVTLPEATMARLEQALPRCDATAAAPTAEAIAAAIAAFDPRAGVEERTGDLVDVR